MRPRLAVALVLASALLAPGAATAQRGKPVKLGFAYIFSGTNAIYGQFARQGAELAIEEVNRQGGILGRQVEARFEDEAGKPDVGIRVVRKLVFDDGVDAVIGLDSSGTAEGVAPVMPELETPLIITHAATPHVTGARCNAWTFRISLSLPQNIAIASTIAAEGKARRWTTVGPDYAFGHESWEYFKKDLARKKPGVTFVADGEAAFPPSKTTDFSPYITKVMASDADGVLVSLWGGNLIDFVKQANELGFFKGKREILMTLGAATEVLTALGDRMPAGLWVGTRYWFQGSASPMNKAFVEGYRKKFGVYPSYNAHGAYAAVLAYKAAAEKAKSTDKAAVAKALEGLAVEVPLGKIVIRAEDHQAVQDGVWGRTAAGKGFDIRILEPMRRFPGDAITPPVAETGCKMTR
ncbi:ABC transporter substrate-binding protein [Anaeromyxobacter sp. Fw109-5]|uniref:ABC transporter substrate-binding protein n=1 Tax=Anaeromyxobacter sp. (strain Fw109-5) TaxID=404589 RepID=UPI0000ED8006|nr:ABC transporter substrate-binding protein [Anaeromyxobacter sp. Fw109-5]ABS25381.1 Extracellular ligand-binding receptor [Anaeromyxobacter sp. Fw109-5]